MTKFSAPACRAAAPCAFLSSRCCPGPLLWLAGNGLIAETVCEFAQHAGFDVEVNDSQASESSFLAARRIVSNDGQYQELTPNPGDFVLIATHHKGDYISLTRVLQSEAAYIGLVSSRKRAELIIARLAKEGVAQDALKRIRAPAGLDFGR